MQEKKKRVLGSIPEPGGGGNVREALWLYPTPKMFLIGHFKILRS